MAYQNYYGPPPQTHPNGTTILVLGILSLVICSFLGPFAWAMGTRALREIDSSGHYFDNRGQVQAGRVCGIISTVLLAIGLGLTIVILALALLAGAFA
ncbi:DUF4190 domain-containing protein [Nonomuraea aridisoli]|uniref:DUF4190 domain-containing protein n=1 Tax=Nonomuraea aridisoli TaxID=2070368 RepID=A0A2W2DNW2_9ACTN|nr:DUF4190 domain-containing protein [Nonomuraea aridisoli]PZG13616.1 hypothetical protein C1J01_29505 [Nonomuraea aridisoli]